MGRGREARNPIGLALSELLTLIAIIATLAAMVIPQWPSREKSPPLTVRVGKLQHTGPVAKGCLRGHCGTWQ